MILALITLIVPALTGMVLIHTLDLLQEKMLRIVVGAIGGISLFTILLYIISLLIPITPILLGAISGLLCVAIYFLIKPHHIEEWRLLPLDHNAVIVWMLVCLLSTLIVPKLLFATDTGLSTGILNAYGDVAWHTANITAFSQGQSFPPQNPILAGSPLIYPFLSNFLSGVLMIAGAPLQASIVLPAFFLIPLIFTLMYCFVRDMNGGNKAAGWIGFLLFLFGGATFGWTHFAHDLKESGLPLAEFLLKLPARDYVGSGGDPDKYVFLNPLTSLFLPQRSFLFGIPLALSLLLLVTSDKLNRRRHFLAAGILAGILPLFHAHTILALVPVIILLVIRYPYKEWVYFFTSALVIGLPGVLYYQIGTTGEHSFFRFEPRWMAGDLPLYLFWIKNTGLLILLGVIGMLAPAPHKSRVLAVGGTLLFIVANIFLFAPWAWDNFKIFIYWFIFVLPVIAWCAALIWNKFNYPLARLALIAVLLLHTSSAALDLWKLSLPEGNTWQEWPTDGITTAQLIQSTTKPGESIVTAPVHDSPVVLAGRPIYLGFPGHIWSHGGNYAGREAAIESLYTTGQIPTWPDTHVPTYIFVGPQEKYKYKDISIPTDWQLVFIHKDYSLYRLPASS